MAKGKYQEWLTEEGLLQLEAWARDGLTEEQIAHNMGINRRTLTDWKNKYTPISLTLKRGKEVVDIQVENALLKRALGYTYKEVTREKIFNPETGQYELMPTKEVTKEVVPDTTAQIFWLKNRRPEQWRDKRDVSVEGELNTNNPFAGLSTDELRKIIENEE
ncbi:helix-turn-helix domain-containing protein [Longicatena sp. 210702-DFI.1.36]|uniref:helix-turn-helix domain-containing protein n=1 Tax=Bacillota TaxID=1239 RepID=UPI001D0950BA|nr:MULTISPECIES: helix-turn-helix domain-containing protein [Longicatena]MCB6265521.1 helix-turn-helix domain-containing protein [Longicatena sp. 210702-DFI.1.160]MCB6316326.1 helix-turn-helix domain-containing protein [Longicatena sp. 210702-DFI.1.100]MCB6430115.1 helix-turn-helix domain-containing protein [Longicatena sp. 210702-DFI.1.36]MCB6432996.1 helix-turn-helix domain-containing protein [Longicatena sp. 210702-DFI.1.249]MCB6439713.1 helix-turn-helix domain-containing protein [Longicate